MILDNLDQAPKYALLSPHFTKAFDFLKEFDGSQENGRYDIDGDNVYAMVQRYTTKPRDQGVFEAHRKYIDVQFVSKGRETILWAPLEQIATRTTSPYNDEKDYALFALDSTATPLRLRDGQFAILFPQDGHVPCCQWDEPCEVTKVVVKVRV